uniref:Putative secreted protein n=1 Tax=Anopheles darlingi TaxID=43151 RepID=A0A2M4DDX8_ANODA
MWLMIGSRLFSGILAWSVRKTRATANSACSGQGNTQSIVVLPTSPGKLRQRLRSVSPSGDMQSTTCKLRTARSRKNDQTPSLLGA